MEPKRLFSLVQSGLVFLALGNYTEAQQAVQAALEADPDHVPALFAAAQLLLASAKYRIVQGTPGPSIFSSSFFSLVHLLPVWIPAVVVCLLCRCLLIWGISQRPLSLIVLWGLNCFRVCSVGRCLYLPNSRGIC